MRERDSPSRTRCAKQEHDTWFTSQCSKLGSGRDCQPAEIASGPGVRLQAGATCARAVPHALPFERRASQLWGGDERVGPGMTPVRRVSWFLVTRAFAARGLEHVSRVARVRLGSRAPGEHAVASGGSTDEQAARQVCWNLWQVCVEGLVSLRPVESVRKREASPQLCFAQPFNSAAIGRYKLGLRRHRKKYAATRGRPT